MNQAKSDLQIHGKPFLRWAGSKRKQLPRLAAFWENDKHTRYIEPFCGSACLFFKLGPEASILGDSNHELIELYKVVKNDPERLYKRLNRIKRDLPTYLRWREKKAASLDQETRALRFLYLNRNCFNGIYRTNSKGQFNVPMGRDPGAYLSLEDFLNCAKLLKNTKLISGDFTKSIAHTESGDFVYLDPPFALTSRRMFCEYGNGTFGLPDIPRLDDSLKQIDKSRADFLVSYADCTEARKIAKSWNSIRLPIRRSIAGFTENRKIAYEWLITNLEIPLSIKQN